jgi:integrase/recombinase XerD
MGLEMKIGLSLKESEKEYRAFLLLKNFSQQTIGKYMWVLKSFSKYFSSKQSIVSELKLKDIKGYLSDRFYHINHKGRQNKESTRNREIAVIKSYLKYLYKSNQINRNWAEEIEYIREEGIKLSKDILSKRELVKLFKQPDPKTEYGKRDRVMLETLYATGIRRNELANLKVSDINFRRETIFIEKGKGGKDRVVPVCKTVLDLLREYLKTTRKKLIKSKENKIVFPRTKGQKMNSNNVGDILRKHFKKAKFKKPFSLHSLRHSFATHLIVGGMPVRHVQELLGHEKLDTTILYLQLNIKDLQREYRKCHPRERSP